MNILNEQIIWVLLFILSFQLVFALNVTGLDGSDVEITPEFCSDELAGMEALGSDFHLYCESNFEEEYYDVPSDILVEFRPVDSAPEDVILVEEEAAEGSVNISDDLIDKPGEDLIESEDDLVEDLLLLDNWKLFLGIGGIILLLVFIVLMFAHHLAKNRDLKSQIANLQPYLQSLRNVGYTDDQIEGLFIKQGYSSSFINRLLNKN